jgi:hypothetical protein
MPKTKRDLLKRKLAQAYNLIDKATAYITEVGAEFDGVHEQETESLGIVVATCESLKMILDLFCQDTWGMDPDEIKKWIP